MDLELRQMNDDFETSCLVLRVESSGAGEPGWLEAGLDALLELSGQFGRVIRELPVLDEGEPQFGFLWEVKDPARRRPLVLDERDFFFRAASFPEFHEKIARYVQDVIAFKTDSGQSLYVHEELEAGSLAMESLLEESNEYLILYIDFLDSIDLNRTVEQQGIVTRLASRLNNDERVMLEEALEDMAEGEVLLDCLQSGSDEEF